jgi:hypothetical protein
MNFNDKCIYHSEIENGAENGKDKGISFQDGDKRIIILILVVLSYASG